MCDDNDILLIFDEVQSGGGITGRMWAHEHFGVAPDIMAFGKKLQVCGVMAGKRIDEVEKNCFVESSRINSTWGGNLVDMARGTRILEIIKEDRLLANASNMGGEMKKYFRRYRWIIRLWSPMSGASGLCALLTFLMKRRETASGTPRSKKAYLFSDAVRIP